MFLSLAACASAQAADPPDRVARLAYLRGTVSFSPVGTDDWARASLNRPVIAGDRLWTEPGGRDELQAGGAVIRMDGSTMLTVLTLDDRALQVQLAQGTLNVRVRPGSHAGAVEVDTPNMAVSIQQPGHYRISVDPAGDASVIRVDDGQAQVIGQQQAYLVNPGQAFRFIGPDLRNSQALDPRHRDDFDRWAAGRDRRAEQARSVRYVSPDLIGYDDLDDYGNWRTVADYGPVWVPSRVPRGWAPYRDGHWAWIQPWGWTWIDDAPWGFAVTHYGRWTPVGDSWGWVPGPSRAAPVYAPALVVFAAGANLAGQHRSREQSVAWFPLAPREAYRPPYQASPRYLTAINPGHAAGADRRNDRYANRQVNGAVTAVTEGVFAHARPVRSGAVALPRDAAALAQVSMAAPVHAQRESLASQLGGGHRPAQALLARPAMTHMHPAIAAGAPHGQPFAHQGPMPQQANRPVAMPAQMPPQAAPAPLPQPAFAGHGRPQWRGENPPPREFAHGHGADGRPAPMPQPVPAAAPQAPAPRPVAMEPPGGQEHGHGRGPDEARGNRHAPGAQLPPSGPAPAPAPAAMQYAQHGGQHQPPTLPGQVQGAGHGAQPVPHAAQAEPNMPPQAPHPRSPAMRMPPPPVPLVAHEQPHGPPIVRHEQPQPAPTVMREPPHQGPPVMHEPPRPAPQVAHQPPRPAPPVMHEPPHLAPPVMHEPPHPAPQVMHQPPHPAPPVMHEPPHQAPPVMHEPPHPAPQVMHQPPHGAPPPPVANAAPPVHREPPHAPPQQPPHAAPPAQPQAHPGKSDEHGPNHGEGGKHKDDHH